jgi:hypothetical protein
VWKNTSRFLGFRDDKTIETLRITNDKKEAKHLPIHAKVMLRTLIHTRRFLAGDISDKVAKEKFINMMNEFTSQTALNTFTPSHSWSNDIIPHTIRFLMELANNKFVEMRLLGCYYTFYFIMHLYNQKKRSLSGCILSNASFRDIVIDKTNEVRNDLRNTISRMPYGFIEKVIRILSYVNTRLSKLNGP